MPIGSAQKQPRQRGEPITAFVFCHLCNHLDHLELMFSLQALLELCPGEDDQLVDLAGDSGAVGRLGVSGEPGEGGQCGSALRATCQAKVCESKRHLKNWTG